jgi:hypothetical protein
MIAWARQPFRDRHAPTIVPAPSIPRAALATALLVTLVELALLFFALSPRRFVVPRGGTPTAGERVAFVVPALPAAPTPERGDVPERASASTAAATGEPAASVPAAVLAAPHDSVPAGIPPSGVAGARAPGERAVSDGGSPAGPVLAPRGFNPSSPLTRRVIDSVLDSLNAQMPALIWARVPTQAERDAAYKEGALAIRLSGRALLVPADPHLAPGLRLPSFFSRRKQRDAARAHTDSILAENMERLARLRARAQRDSLRRDALQRADSIRRADSLRAASPRRRPDARTPA